MTFQFETLTRTVENLGLPACWALPSDPSRELIDRDLCELEGDGAGVVNRGLFYPLAYQLKSAMDHAEANYRARHPHATSSPVHRLCLRLADAQGNQLRLTAAKPESKNPGYFYVHDEDGNYAGKISPEGVYAPSETYAPEWVLPMLQASNADTLQAAIGYGKVIGRCAFCGRALTVPLSRELGYGPVCAGNWGLTRKLFR